jgi:2-keto-4-pentenoate hydratase/2-oxohepta-3-ene-1,7-dioic acid hydratase in catechol pathway
MSERPLPPAILAIGRNYADHAKEMGGAIEPHPTVFMKNPAAAIADGEAIVIPAICREHGPQVDFEGELAIVIGEACRDVAELDAARHIAGRAPAGSSAAGRASTPSARSARRCRRPRSAIRTTCDSSRA